MKMISFIEDEDFKKAIREGAKAEIKSMTRESFTEEVQDILADKLKAVLEYNDGYYINKRLIDLVLNEKNVKKLWVTVQEYTLRRFNEKMENDFSKEVIEKYLKESVDYNLSNFFKNLTKEKE